MPSFVKVVPELPLESLGQYAADQYLAGIAQQFVGTRPFSESKLWLARETLEINYRVLNVFVIHARSCLSF